MDVNATACAAQQLQAVARRLITDGHIEVQDLLGALDVLLQKAINHEILAPLEWRSIPGDWHFEEGSLRNFPELESAYAHFKVEATGEPSPVLQRLRDDKL